MAKKESYRIDIPISVVAENLEEVKRIEKLLKNLDKKKAKPQVDVDAKDAKKKAKEVEKELDKVDKKKAKPRVVVDVDDRQAKRKLSAFERVKRRKQEITIGAKDQASAVINRVKGRMAQLKSSNAARITITAVDRTRGVVNSIRKAITSAPAMITVGASAVGGAMGGAAAMSYITGGMEQARTQEHDMVRMTHWLKKDQENMKDMTGALNDSVRFTKQYASSTAFDMAPVNAAYATALQIAGGERGEAEKLLKIAGDMAILDDGDITRSMQAIFNAQNGLYEMMDAYSPTKINKEFVDSKGGMDGLLKFMEGETGGAAIAYGDTGVGAYNTMLGKMSLLKTEIGEAFHKGSIPFYKQLSELFTKASDSAGPLLSIIEKIGVEIGNWSFDKMESAINTMKKAVGFDKVEDIFGGGYSTQVAATINPKSLSANGSDLFKPIDLSNVATTGKITKKGSLIENSKWTELQEQFKESAEKGLHLVQMGDSGYAFDLRKSVEENMADGPIPVSFEAKTETAIDSVKDSLSDWWQGEGKTAMLEVGEELGGKVVDAIVEGVPAIAEALASVIGGVVSDKVGEAIKNPSVGTIAGAGVAIGGAGLLGNKLLSPVGGYRGAWEKTKKMGGHVGRGIGGIGGFVGNLFGGGRGRRRPPVRTTFAEQDRRAREYSTRPENYRPPQQTQRRAGGSGSGSPQNLGFASGGGPMSFMPKWLQGGGGGKVLKGIGGKVPGLNMLLGGVDAYSGFKDADRRAGGEAGGLDKAASSFATVLEGFTFGLLDGDKTYEKIRGKKVPGEEVAPEINGAKSDEGLKGALPENDAFEAFREMGDAGGMSEIVQQFQERLEAITEGLEGVDEFAESFDAVSEIFEQLEESLTSMTENLEEPAEQFAESFTEVAEMMEEMQESLEELSEALEEPTEQFVESFTEVAEMMEEMKESLEELSESLEEPTEQFVESFTEVAELMEQLQETIEEFNESMQEPVEQFVESFTQVAENMEQINEMLQEFAEGVAEPSQQFIESLTEVSMMLEQSVETLEEFNSSITEGAAELTANMTTLGQTLIQSGEVVQTGMNAIGSKTSEVVGALGTLVGHINTGASAMSGMSQVQSHVTALNSALQGLTAKVRNVQVPSSIGGGGGPTKAYAKGGIATSPHIGLVAEAGVPEAMIPFDGSSRSKDLWMTTGHALGMFDTSTSSIDPIDTTPKPTPQESGGSNTFNIPINISNNGNAEEIIEQAKQEVASALRLVLSTT